MAQIRALKEKEAKLQQELKVITAESPSNRISLEDTFKEIEMSTLELKEMAEKRDQQFKNNINSDPIKGVFKSALDSLK